MAKIDPASADALALTANNIMQASGQIAGLAGSLMTVCETAPGEVDNCVAHFDRAVDQFSALCRQLSQLVEAVHNAKNLKFGGAA